MVFVYTVMKIQVPCKLNNLLTSLVRRVTKKNLGIRDKSQEILRIIMGNVDSAIGCVFGQCINPYLRYQIFSLYDFHLVC